MSQKPKLIDHRKALSINAKAYTYEFENGNIERLIKTLIPHLRDAGFSATASNSFDPLKRIIQYLFEAQDNRPLFHFEGTFHSST